MVHCYWVMSKKWMCDFPWWLGTQASLLSSLLDLQRTYVEPKDNTPIKYIMWFQFEFMLDDWYNGVREKMEQYKQRWWDYWFLLEKCNRYDYLKSHIDIWTKALNILIHNYIVKHKLWEVDYPDDVVGLDEMSYSDYLKTDRWTVIKWAALKRDWKRCVLCWSDKNLCCHHRSYKYKWLWDYHKELEDVHVLCERCHKMFHDNVDIKELY